MMLSREEQRAIVNRLTTINIDTKIMVEPVDCSLRVMAKGGLNDEQRAIIAEYSQDILSFITTPPLLSGELSGECVGGHPVQWVCSNYGVWICRCYYGGNYHLPTIAEPTKPINVVSSSTKDAWINGTVNHLKPTTKKRKASGF